MGFFPALSLAIDSTFFIILWFLAGDLDFGGAAAFPGDFDLAACF